MTSQTLFALFITVAAHAGLGTAIYTLSPLALVPKERCNNDLDDDENGLTDCDDPVCTVQPKVDTACRTEVCTNGVDDDNDGLSDCDDPDCAEAPINAACLLPVPFVVKLEPPPPPPEPEPEPEPEPVKAPEPVIEPTPAPKVNTKPPPSSPPKETPPPNTEPPPIVFGIAMDGGTDGPGMEIPEGNTLGIDPSKSDKVKGPIKPLTGNGVPDGAGTEEPKPQLPPVPKEVSAAEVTTKPKQMGCDDSTTKEYPQAAREAGVEGKISVELLIDDKGKVIDAKVMKGLGFGLDELAVERAKTCSFEPATKEGKAVAFRLKGFPVIMQIQ
jgi:periplasmic protein TonB